MEVRRHHEHVREPSSPSARSTSSGSNRVQLAEPPKKIGAKAEREPRAVDRGARRERAVVGPVAAELDCHREERERARAVWEQDALRRCPSSRPCTGCRTSSYSPCGHGRPARGRPSHVLYSSPRTMMRSTVASSADPGDLLEGRMNEEHAGLGVVADERELLRCRARVDHAPAGRRRRRARRRLDELEAVRRQDRGVVSRARPRPSMTPFATRSTRSTSCAIAKRPLAASRSATFPASGGPRADAIGDIDRPVGRGSFVHMPTFRSQRQSFTFMRFSSGVPVRRGDGPLPSKPGHLSSCRSSGGAPSISTISAAGRISSITAAHCPSGRKPSTRSPSTQPARARQKCSTAARGMARSQLHVRATLDERLRKSPRRLSVHARVTSCPVLARSVTACLVGRMGVRLLGSDEARPDRDAGRAERERGRGRLRASRSRRRRAPGRSTREAPSAPERERPGRPDVAARLVALDDHRVGAGLRRPWPQPRAPTTGDELHAGGRTSREIVRGSPSPLRTTGNALLDTGVELSARQIEACEHVLFGRPGSGGDVDAEGPSGRLVTHTGDVLLGAPTGLHVAPSRDHTQPTRRRDRRSQTPGREPAHPGLEDGALDADTGGKTPSVARGHHRLPSPPARPSLQHRVSSGRP